MLIRSSLRYGVFKTSRRVFLRHHRLFTAGGAGKPSSSPSVLSKLIGWYSHKLDTSPIMTKMLSAGLISGTGQVLSQYIIYDPESGKDFQIDWMQTGRFMVLNILFVAPVLHHWYTWIDKAVPGKEMIPVIKRVFYDEFVFTPVYIPVIMGLLWGMEGNEPAKIPKMIGAEFWNIMLFDWCVYIPVQLVNFRYVPVKYQVLVINLCGVGWNTFICWRGSHQQNQHTNDVEADSAKAPHAVEDVH